MQRCRPCRLGCVSGDSCIALAQHRIGAWTKITCILRGSSVNYAEPLLPAPVAACRAIHPDTQPDRWAGIVLTYRGERAE